MKGKSEVKAKPLIEAAVNVGVVHGGAHGKPEEGQINLLDKMVEIDVLRQGAQDEAEVTGQPAKC